MFKYLIFNNPTLYCKMNFFKKRIKEFRKTKKFDLLTTLNIDKRNVIKDFLANLFVILSAMFLLTIIYVGVILLILFLTDKSFNTAGLVAIIVAFIGIIGTIYVEYKKRKDLKRDRFDFVSKFNNSIFNWN